MLHIATPAGVRAIPLARPDFLQWRGAPPGDSYGSKLFLEHRGRPLFAEFIILELFRETGWSGLWVDSFRRRFWADPGTPAQPLPEAIARLIVKIYGRSGFPRGCWDIICWKDGEVIFVEAKKAGEDRIRGTQSRWLHSGLTTGGLQPTDFLVVEWRTR